jgi:SAM-dependent methyltransferase
MMSRQSIGARLFLLRKVIRTFLKKKYPLACGYYVLDDLCARLRYSVGNISTTSGTNLQRGGVAAALARIELIFADYKRFAGVERFHGKIAEIGPGDNCGVALLMLNDGAESVHLVDRFHSKRSGSQQRALYSSLFDRHEGLRERFGAVAVDEASCPGLCRSYGLSAENFFSSHAAYDFIVSCAVLEHCYDPLGLLRKMAAALNPRGQLLHSVDLRDHGMFSEHFHELKFLEVPGGLYRQMSQAAGRPNRVLIDVYRSTLQQLGLESTLWITRIAGVSERLCCRSFEEISLPLRRQALECVSGVRSKFDPLFDDVSDEDLCVTGFFLVAGKR